MHIQYVHVYYIYIIYIYIYIYTYIHTLIDVCICTDLFAICAMQIETKQTYVIDTRAQQHNLKAKFSRKVSYVDSP